MKTKEAWVRVRKASELRAGMALRAAQPSGKWFYTIAIRERGRQVPCAHAEDAMCNGWRFLPDPHGWEDFRCVTLIIAAGALFRLSSAALSETDSTERAPRERELTNAKG